MKVKLLNGSENPEELVCTAARNDYRSDGVFGHSFDEVMEGIEADDEHIEDATTESSLLRSRTASKKRTLIDHLMRSGHWGPFEHPQAVVAIEGVTRVLMAQITRHRHFSFDVMSLRYVGLDDGFGRDGPEIYSENPGKSVYGAITDRFQVPEFRGEDFDVDRDGVHEIDDPDVVEDIYVKAYKDAVAKYLALLDQGVPQEQARKVLPMGTKVNIVMSGNARAWMHILKVRTKADVQGETRRCAEAIFDELKDWMPYTMEQYDEMLPMELGP